MALISGSTKLSKGLVHRFEWLHLLFLFLLVRAIFSVLYMFSDQTKLHIYDISPEQMRSGK